MLSLQVPSPWLIRNSDRRASTVTLAMAYNSFEVAEFGRKRYDRQGVKHALKVNG
jgi:hypothetical protein